MYVCMYNAPIYTYVYANIEVLFCMLSVSHQI